MDESERLIWIDMEMSGLDPERERVLEIAVLVTDGNLEVVAEGPDLVVHQPDEILRGMDEWNTEHHGASGLTERVREASLSEAEAEAKILGFLREHCEAGACPLAGNSVHQDRRFLRRYLPALDAFLHYRIVDVSTVKELARRWYPGVYASAPEKVEAHRAMADIHESLAELRWYRERIFAAPPASGENP